MHKLIRKVSFLIVWNLGRLMGFMPLWVQYGIADICYIVIYYIVRYRVEVTRENLKNSFPEKRVRELRIIERKFYRHLADVLIETITLVSFSEEDIKKRITYKNVDLLVGPGRTKSSIAAMAHYASWEYTIGFRLYADCGVLAVYHPLSNSIIDDYYREMRSRFGTRPVPMHDVAKEIVKKKNVGERCILALIADQTPPRPHIKKWHDFLNQKTAFFMGMEKLALKYGMPIVFTDVKKVKRGYYEASFINIYDGVEDVSEFEITERYAAILEEVIRREPHLWMWSHRRWKHKPYDEIV